MLFIWRWVLLFWDNLKNCKMKILVIPSWFCNSESPNAGSFFREEASLMAKSHAIAIMYFERIPIEQYASGTCRIEVDGDLTIFRFNLPFDSFKSWEDNLKSYINEVLSSFSKVIEYGFVPDIIHAYSTFMGGIFARWIAKSIRIPYLITEHFGPYNPDFLHSNYAKEQMQLAMEDANCLLCVSNFLRQQILMTGVHVNPIVIGNYVNDTLFQLSERENEGKRLLSIAYFPGYIKDLDTQLKCYQYMIEDGIDFSVTIIGGGESSGGYTSIDGNIIERKVYEYGLESVVHVIGAADRLDMARLMDECDIFVSSSIAETFGVSICEAMLCGKLCVLTNNGGSGDYANSTNSIIVEIHNPRALANGIEKMMLHKAEFNTQYIREGIESKYGAASFQKRMNSILKKFDL